MPKSEEFTSEVGDHKAKKIKKSPPKSWTICRQPKCAAKLIIPDEMDPDLEIAKHNKHVHDISYPAWVDGLWDKYHKPAKPKYKKYDNEKKSY